MIDDPLKTAALIEKIKAHVPIPVALTARLRHVLAQKSPDVSVPQHGNVVDVMNLGDEGGIACALDLGAFDAEAGHFVSLTHLSVDRRTPLFREIDAYQRHRIKKLKRQAGRGF